MFATSSAAVAQSPEQPEVRAHETAPSFRIRVETSLVTVTVVVRDRNGRPVRNLEKKDFRLFDSGKPQEITGFRVEITDPKSTGAETHATPSSTTQPPVAQPTPQRFVALFFDDFHMPIEDVTRTRNAAWHYLSTAMRPEDRVAVFTSSATEQVDFTNDRDKLHDSLFRLAPHSRTIPFMNRCPAIDEYQAYLIDRLQEPSALDIATGEGYECHCNGEGDATLTCRDAQMRQARGDAAQIWGLADMQSQWALEAVRLALRRLAAMPGQRTMVLVSPGFLTMTRSNDVDALVNRAVQQNIVINAIDAAGLYTKISHSRLTGARPDFENQKLQIARDVLAGLSAGTGGIYFQNSNNFDQGFREAAQVPEVYYLLSFSPQNVTLDGKFHALKVTVNSGVGWEIQARRGYFANAETEPAKSELESLVFSQEEQQGLRAMLTALPGPSIVTVKIRVDAQALQFRKEADRSLDTLIFDTALFDHDGKYVAGKESSLDFRLSDAKLEKLQQSGINAETVFQVAPGSYRIREVVRETGTNKMAALNGSVAVTTAPQVQAAVSPAPPTNPTKQKKEKKTKSMLNWSVAEFEKAMPELTGLEPAENQEPLTTLLEKTGQNVKSFFDGLPDITAREKIELKRLDWTQYRTEEFNYLDLPRPVPNGVGMEEFRTNAAGKRAEPQSLEHGFVTKGFTSMAIHFHPLYEAESVFRYLGNQSLDGRSAAVVYFAQTPKARVKQGLTTDIRSLQILIQGLAWIDSNSYQIVRMRTELLVPYDDPDLRGETTESRFEAVRFKGVPQDFWLPEDVTVTLDWRGMVFRNHHHYSQFELFHVDSR